MKKTCLLALLLPLTVTDIFAQDSDATQRLLERNRMFEPTIIEVAENVYTAIGYQVSANTMIVGDVDVLWIKAQEAMTADDPRGAIRRSRPSNTRPGQRSMDPVSTIVRGGRTSKG